MQIFGGAELDIRSNGTLTTPVFNCDGTMSVAGGSASITGSGSVALGGVLSVTSGGTLNCAGAVDLFPNSTLTVTNAGSNFKQTPAASWGGSANSTQVSTVTFSNSGAGTLLSGLNLATASPVILNLTQRCQLNVASGLTVGPAGSTLSINQATLTCNGTAQFGSPGGGANITGRDRRRFDPQRQRHLEAQIRRSIATVAA